MWTGAEQAQEIAEVAESQVDSESQVDFYAARSESAVHTVDEDPLIDPCIAVSFDQQLLNTISSSTDLNHRFASEGDDLPRHLSSGYSCLRTAIKRQRKLPYDASYKPID